MATPELDSMPTFGRMTDRARSIIKSAAREASRLGNSWIGTEHILLALVREPVGIGGALLRDRGVSPELLHREVAAVLGGPQRGPGDEPPLTALTDKVRRLIASAHDECRALQHNYAGTEHLLLGLLATAPSVACAVIERLGLSRDELRRDVLGLLGHL